MLLLQNKLERVWLLGHPHGYRFRIMTLFNPRTANGEQKPTPARTCQRLVEYSLHLYIPAAIGGGMPSAISIPDNPAKRVAVYLYIIANKEKPQ